MKGLPIVFFDRIPEQINTHKITADNAKGAFDATSHLIRCGHKKIAHISSSANLSISSERFSGYIKALAENSLPIDYQYIKNSWRE